MLPIIYVVRQLLGFVYGVNHTTVIMHATENYALEYRGMVYRWVAYSKLFMLIMATGIFASHKQFKVILGFGYIHFLVAAAIFIIIFKYYVNDSSSHSLENQQNDGEIINETIEFRIVGLKLKVERNKYNEKNVFANGNIKPLLLVIGGRVLSALISSLPLLTEPSWLFASMSNMSAETFRIIFLFQFLFALMIVIVSEFFNFKKFFCVAGIIWALIVIILFVIDIFFTDASSVAYCVALVGYTLIALGVNVLTYNQLSEAFASTKRAWSIAFVTFVESLAYLTIFILFIIGLPYLNLMIFVGIVAISVLLYAFIPNARSLLLRNVRFWFKWSKDKDGTNSSAK